MPYPSISRLRACLPALPRCSAAAPPSRPMAASADADRRLSAELEARMWSRSATTETALRRQGACRPVPEAAADGGFRGADRAAQQSRPAGRLQRPRHRRGADGRRQPAAQSALRHLQAIGALRAGDRTADRGQPLRARDLAGPGRNRARTLPARHSSARPKRCSGSLPIRAGSTIAPSRPMPQVGFFQQAKASTDAASELFKRLGESGGVNKLDQAREFAFDAELGAQLAQARLQQRQERERLVRQLGLWGDDLKFRSADTLPPLPRLQTGQGDRSRGAAQTCRPAGRARRSRHAGEVAGPHPGNPLRQRCRSARAPHLRS